MRRRPASAANHLENARSFFLAASELLGEAPEPPEDLRPAFWMLIGFSVELALKAVALGKGVPQEVVERWGHKLLDAYDGVMPTGALPPYETDLIALVRAIEKEHRELHYRYTPSDLPEIVVPPARWAMEPLSVLISLAALAVPGVVLQPR